MLKLKVFDRTHGRFLRCSVCLYLTFMFRGRLLWWGTSGTPRWKHWVGLREDISPSASSSSGLNERVLSSGLRLAGFGSRCSWVPVLFVLSLTRRAHVSNETVKHLCGFSVTSSSLSVCPLVSRPPAWSSHHRKLHHSLPDGIGVESVKVLSWGDRLLIHCLLMIMWPDLAEPADKKFWRKTPNVLWN